MRKIGKKIYELRHLLIILSVCACYAGILYNQTMPFAEGGIVIMQNALIEEKLYIKILIIYLHRYTFLSL